MTPFSSLHIIYGLWSSAVVFWIVVAGGTNTTTKLACETHSPATCWHTHRDNEACNQQLYQKGETKLITYALRILQPC